MTVLSGQIVDSHGHKSEAIDLICFHFIKAKESISLFLQVRMQISRKGHELAPSARGIKGIMAMYRGIMPPMMTSGFVSSLNFGGFELVGHNSLRI